MSNVTTGKPAVAGGVWRAPLNTALPTDATTQLSAAYKSIGYITEDGVSLTNDFQKDVIKAWGGDIVCTSKTGEGYGLEFGMMEHKNTEVLKMSYGDSNVTASGGDITIDATGEAGDSAVYVIERVTSDGKADRIVIPHGDITKIGNVSFKDSDAIVYPATIKMIKSQIGDKMDYFKEFIEGESA